MLFALNCYATNCNRVITALEHTCNTLLQAPHPSDSTRVRGCVLVQGWAVLSLPEHVCHLFQVLAIVAHQIKMLALKVSSNDAAIQQALKAVQQLEDGSYCGAVIECLQSSQGNELKTHEPEYRQHLPTAAM